MNKTIFSFFLFLVASFAAPLDAQDALPSDPPSATPSAEEYNQTCLIGGGNGYQSCAAEPHNNSLIEKGLSAARIMHGTSNSEEGLWVHGLCKFIDNRSSDKDYFIPFATAQEWLAFTQNMPKDIVASGCCTPRTLNGRDMVTPTQPCTGGWQLLGATGPADLSNLIMRVEGDGNFIGTDGQLVQLPVARDNGNTLFEYAGVKEFAARFRCGGGAGGADGADDGFPVDDKPEDDIEVIGEVKPADAGEIGHVPFRVVCRNGDWSTISVRPCTESAYEYSASCETYGYPQGTVGDVRVRVRSLCPTGQQVEEVIAKNCGG